MSDIIQFNGVQLGDSGVLLVPTLEPLARAAAPLLGSTFAHLDDSSPNWLYRIQAAVVITRNSAPELIAAVASLRAALGGAKADLVWKSGSLTRLTWPDARLDLIRHATPDDRRRAGFDPTLILEFSSASDPE